MPSSYHSGRSLTLGKPDCSVHVTNNRILLIGSAVSFCPKSKRDTLFKFTSFAPHPFKNQYLILSHLFSNLLHISILSSTNQLSQWSRFILHWEMWGFRQESTNILPTVYLLALDLCSAGPLIIILTYSQLQGFCFYYYPLFLLHFILSISPLLDDFYQDKKNIIL